MSMWKGGEEQAERKLGPGHAGLQKHRDSSHPELGSDMIPLKL